MVRKIHEKYSPSCKPKVIIDKKQKCHWAEEEYSRATL